MTDDPAVQPTEESQARPFSPNDALPTVEPPSATFLLQLFLIPLLIVSMIVMVWMLFSWLAQAGNDPREMVLEIQAGKGDRWQKAVTLANMLKHENAQSIELRRDAAFARKIGEILHNELKIPLSDAKANAEALKVRYYLCRTLGQMETPEVIPPLLEAATLERHPVEATIRLGALEALAVLAKKLGAEKFLAEGKTLPVLLECSRAQDLESAPAEQDQPDFRPHGELRGAAAFTLGIVGGTEALERLAVLLEDTYPSVRYNAATGLARAGDERAVEVLLEMLDPANRLAAVDERSSADQANRRFEVLKNGISATLLLVEKSPQTNRARLLAALKNLSGDALAFLPQPQAREKIRLDAKDSLKRRE